jgi:hypothetical protein
MNERGRVRKEGVFGLCEHLKLTYEQIEDTLQSESRTISKKNRGAVIANRTKNLTNVVSSSNGAFGA